MPTSPPAEKTPLLTPKSTGGKKATFDTTPVMSPSSASTPKGQAQQQHQPSQATMKAASKKVDLGHVKLKREVNYSGDSMFGLLFQMYGSVWPKVFPWCVFVSAITAGIYYLRDEGIIDLTMKSNSGHGFISILVSFLVVTRTTITYSRFMEARQHLEDLFRTSREVIQYACAYTLTDTGPKAKAWRQEVAYKMIVCLRMAVAAIEYRGHGINTWEAVHEDEHENTPLILPPNDDDSDDENNNNNDKKKKKKKWLSKKELRHRESLGNYKPSMKNHSYVLRDLSHGPRTLTDENMRAPLVWIYNLRETLVQMRNDKSILPVHPMHVNECLKLNAISSEFVSAFHGLKKLITTPFPFPLVQMTRTFLFFWLFSLPSVLIPGYPKMWEIVMLMFFVTYGFLGLEYVNIELDDPHGQDPNDFPGHRWAQQVFEDIYITIYKMDGFDSAYELRSRIASRVKMGSALQNIQAQ